MGVPEFISLDIAADTATSELFAFQGRRVVGVIVPDAWTDADISFEIEYPDGTWIKMVDRAGALYKLTGIATAASEYHLTSGDANQSDIAIVGASHGRVVSTNTGSEANINQDAVRTVVVVLADQ